MSGYLLEEMTTNFFGVDQKSNIKLKINVIMAVRGCAGGSFAGWRTWFKSATGGDKTFKEL